MRCQFCNLCCAVQLELNSRRKTHTALTNQHQHNSSYDRACLALRFTRPAHYAGPAAHRESTDKARTVSGCWQINTIFATHQRRECNREKPPIPPRELVCTAFPSHASHVKYACGSADGGR
jgi:hypothetical protein